MKKFSQPKGGMKIFSRIIKRNEAQSAAELSGGKF